MRRGGSGSGGFWLRRISHQTDGEIREIKMLASVVSGETVVEKLTHTLSPQLNGRKIWEEGAS